VYSHKFVLAESIRRENGRRPAESIRCENGWRKFLPVAGGVLVRDVILSPKERGVVKLVCRF